MWLEHDGTAYIECAQACGLTLVPREERDALAANTVGVGELIAHALHVASLAEAGLPIDEQSASDLQLDWRFLALRRPENLLVFEEQTTVERVELDDGTVLVCHHPREGVWCCCAEDGASRPSTRRHSMLASDPT